MSKRKERTARKNSEPKGYDHGIKATAFSVGPLDLVNSLPRAEVDGIVYGKAYEPSLGTTVPLISLAGRNAALLRAAFHEFAQWSALSDGDAVELTFVFLKSGGYLVGASPEPTRLQQRMMGFDTTYHQISILPSWIKHIETVGPHTLEFRDYKEKLVSPFLLTAVTYDGPLEPGRVPSVRQVAPELLKFEATILDEDDVEQGSQADMILHVGMERSLSSFKPGHKPTARRLPSPVEVRRARPLALRRSFPVTLARIARSDVMQALKAEVVANGAEAWQFDQAICNMVLSSDITGGHLHYETLASGNLLQEIAKAVATRYELADGKDGLPASTIEQIMRQISLDALFLLRMFGDHAPVGPLSDLMWRLKKLNLLAAKVSKK